MAPVWDPKNSPPQTVVVRGEREETKASARESTANLQAYEEHMRLAINVAREGVAKGQTPFGACIVKDGQVLASAHNTVWETKDVTAHAEVNAIREACRVLGSIDLSGCVLYTTCEPCPMCFSAAHWARITRIVYGATVGDAQKAGFNKLTVSAFEMKRAGGSKVEIIGGILRQECVGVIKEWLNRPDHLTY
ncbi:MAG: nucleoside deaminase [Candidatus Altiarchaeota archaeon]